MKLLRVGLLLLLAAQPLAAQTTDYASRLLGAEEPDPYGIEICERADTPLVGDICKCGFVETATERLDCYDKVARRFRVIRALVEAQANTRAKELAKVPEGVEAMKSVLRELGEIE